MFANKKEIFERYILICGVAGASAGIALGHMWESIAPLIACVIGLMTLDFKLIGLSDDHDRELFNNFLRIFPSDGCSFRFCRDFDTAGGSFNWDNLTELKDFVENWVTPEHQFLNKELEKLRAKLYKTAREYHYYLACNTWLLPIPGINVASVPSEWQTDPEQRGRFTEVTDKLNSLADEIVVLHKRLVSLGLRRGLKVIKF